MSETLAVLARFGYGTHGIIYVVVGALAGVAAFDWRAETTDTSGALLTILSRPLGSILLSIVAAGLVCFAIWNLLQCLADTERLGTKAPSIFTRIGYLGSCVGQLALCFVALNLVFGWEPAGPNAEAEIKDWTSWAFKKPWGRWVVGSIGVLIITGAIAILQDGWRGTFAFRLTDDPRVRFWAVPVGRLGVLAQGVVFCAVGCFLLMAAFLGDPEEARGIAGFFGALRELSHGWMLLSAVAFGLIAYGAYGFVEAAFRKVEPPKRMPLK